MSDTVLLADVLPADSRRLKVSGDLVGKIIEFRVTPELLSILANFIEYQAQVEPAKIDDMQTAEMISRFLKRRKVAVRERVETLIRLIETSRVVPMDADITGAMFRLRESAESAVLAGGSPV